MSTIEPMSPAALCEHYLRSLSPIERMDYELACAREKRLLAERREEETELVRELEELVAAARGFRGKRLSRQAVRRIVERLYGAEVLEASQPSPYAPQPKGRIERISYEIAKGVPA